MKLHDLQPAEGSRKPRTRVGRGIAAGKGKTAGRGTKGQKARAGGGDPGLVRGRPDAAPHAHPEAARLQEPVQDRVRGRQHRRHRRARRCAARSRSRRPAKASAKSAPITVNQDILRAVGLVRTLNKPMKILGAGELSVPLFVVADAFTASARAKIEAAGGSVNVLEIPKTPLAALGVTVEAEAEASTGARERRPRSPPAPPPTSRPRPRRTSRPRQTSRPRRPRRPRPTCRPRPTQRRGSDDAEATTATDDAEASADSHRRDRRRCGDPGRRGRSAVRRRRLTRVRIAPQCLPGAGHPAPDPLCPRPADRLPPAGVRADPGRGQGSAQGLRRGQRAGRPARPVLGRRPVALLGRRVGDEPVHQRLDHHAADDRRRAVAPGAQPRG